MFLPFVSRSLRLSYGGRLVQHRPLAEEITFWAVQRTPPLDDPPLQGLPRHPVHLPVDCHLEDRGKRRPWQSPFRMLFCVADINVRSIEAARGLQVTMPPALRIDDGDRAPALRHEIRITLKAKKRRTSGRARIGRCDPPAFPCRALSKTASPDVRLTPTGTPRLSSLKPTKRL